MNAIIGYSQLLIEDLSEDAQGITEIRRINAAGCDLLAMIDAVLLLAKLDAGKLALYLDRFDLRHLVSECDQSTSRDQGKIEIRCNLPNEQLPIVSDHLQLTYVIKTLL